MAYHFDQNWECPVDEHHILREELIPELLKNRDNMSLLECAWLKNKGKQFFYTENDKTFLYNLKERYASSLKLSTEYNQY